VSFQNALAATLKHEGGFSNHRDDRGGATRFGITEAVARRFGYVGAMPDYPKAEAERVYKLQYWDTLRLDEVDAISEDIAQELFDTGVNMGIGRAGTFLQRALNVLNRGQADYPDLTVDGVIGPATIHSLSAYLLRRQAQGEFVMLRALDGLQRAAYIEIAEKNKVQEAFVFGWLLQRTGP
jgi:lysozyme family protein